MISACNEHTTNCNDCVDYAEKCDGCSAPYHPAMDDLFCGGMCSLRTTVASQQLCPFVPLILSQLMSIFKKKFLKSTGNDFLYTYSNNL